MGEEESGTNTISGRVFQLGYFAKDEISGNHYIGCDFVRVNFSHAIDVIFEKCRFESCIFEGDIYSSIFLACDLEGSSIKEIALDDSQFIDSNFEKAHLVDSSIIGSAFIRCSMQSSRILDCDATMAYFEDCDMSDVALEDSAFYGADLSTCFGLEVGDFDEAQGDSRTLLPPEIPSPAHWLEADMEDPADQRVAGIPGQVAAPLRVTWRENKLVPDPRGYAEQAFKSPAVITIFRALREDVENLADQALSNHPMARHIEALSRAMNKGIAAVNPVELGYQVEMLKAYLPSSHEYLTETTVERVRAVVTGGSILVMQFADWQAVVRNAARGEAGENSPELATAVSQLAASIRRAGETIDRRIALSLETQSSDLSGVTNKEVVAEGVAGSTSNVVSALVTRLWAITKGATSKVGDEVLKYGVRMFLDENKEHLLAIAAAAPKSLGWIREALEQILKP